MTAGAGCLRAKRCQLAASGRPQFVFAHIICPHPPFVFGPDGEEARVEPYLGMLSANHAIHERGLKRREYMRLYVDQARFIADGISEVVDRLIADSAVPPIIILQADHGPGAFLEHENMLHTYLEDRMSILYACYFPGGDYSDMYPEITPVNTFRAVLSGYFDADLEMLEDYSYFSSILAPYDFEDVTERIGDGADVARYELLRGSDHAIQAREAAPGRDGAASTERHDREPRAHTTPG